MRLLFLGAGSRDLRIDVADLSCWRCFESKYGRNNKTREMREDESNGKSRIYGHVCQKLANGLMTNIAELIEKELLGHHKIGTILRSKLHSLEVHTSSTSV